MVRERPLRYAGCLSDVAHAGRPKPALVHYSQAVGEQLFLVRRTWHVPSTRTFLGLSRQDVRRSGGPPHRTSTRVAPPAKRAVKALVTMDNRCTRMPGASCAGARHQAERSGSQPVSDARNLDARIQDPVGMVWR